MIEGWSDIFCSYFNTADGCPVPYCRDNLSEKCGGRPGSINPTLIPLPGEKWPVYKIRLDNIERYLSSSSQEAQEIDESTSTSTSTSASMHSLLPPGDVADLETLPPYEGRQTNIIFRNKYYFRDPRPDQYDFDPNSNVPQSRGTVRSIGRRNPLPRQRLRQRQQRSRIQRRQDKKLEKPAKKSVKVNPKVQKTPPTFAKTINQLLPILLILSIFLFIVYFYKKRGKY